MRFQRSWKEFITPEKSISGEVSQLAMCDLPTGSTTLSASPCSRPNAARNCKRQGIFVRSWIPTLNSALGSHVAAQRVSTSQHATNPF